MSGRPNYEQINQLRAALRQVAAEQNKITCAREAIQTATQTIEAADDRLDKAHAEVRRLLEAMDCAPNGNFGAGHRMTALLTALCTMPEPVR